MEKERITSAVFKVNLHCRQCARKIKKPLLRTQGVQSVEVDIDKSEIKVNGRIQVIQIHEMIKKFSKKKVELINHTNLNLTSKQPTLHTTSFKVQMHCDKCERDLRKTLLKHKGIHSVKTDMKAQIITVERSMEADKIASYLQKKVHKHAEIITTTEKKEEQKNIISSKSESTKIIQVKEEEEIIKSKETTIVNPYFIHYVYAPQLFSDDNPNACSVM